MLLKHCKAQIFFIVLFLLNLWCTFWPMWTLRKAALRMAGCRFGSGSVVHRRVKLFHPGRLVLGEGSVVNEGCYLDTRRGITIGRQVSIAHDVKIYTLGHDIEDPQFAAKGAPVVIGDYVVIFANALIMPGVSVGDGAVVLPGSVVTKDIPPQAVVGGVPAVVVKQRNLRPAYSLSYPYWFAH